MRSAEGNDACVEIARTNHGIHVRDSKNADGPILHLNQAAWQALAHRIKQGDCLCFRAGRPPGLPAANADGRGCLSAASPPRTATLALVSTGHCGARPCLGR
jgi:hypothetical protein